MGAILITGIPRTGTSLGMRVCREQYGEDMIVGSDTRGDVPDELSEEALKQMRPEVREINQYLYKNVVRDKTKARMKKMQDMNPTGFWETKYTVNGLKWNYGDKELFELLKKEQRILKVVSSGLIQSNPEHIDKVVYTLRDPRSAAKSQQRLRRGPSIREGESLSETMSKDGVHVTDAKMFIDGTYHAAKFFLENPDIPVYMYKYDDLVANPKDTLKGIFEFMTGAKRVKKAAVDIIKPKLKRSKPVDVEGLIWDEADALYELFQERKFQEIVDFYENDEREVHIQKRRWFCPRISRMVTKPECENCTNIPEVTKNFIKEAARKGVKHAFEPCTYECGFNGKKPKTVAQSIAKSHWKSYR